MIYMIRLIIKLYFLLTKNFDMLLTKLLFVFMYSFFIYSSIALVKYEFIFKSKFIVHFILFSSSDTNEIYSNILIISNKVLLIVNT